MSPNLDNSNLFERLSRYCQNYIDPEISVILLRCEKDITVSYFNLAACELWKVPPPRVQNIKTLILGKSIYSLLARSARLGKVESELREIAKTALQVGGEIGDAVEESLNHTLKFKIAQFDDEELEIEAHFQAFTDGNQTALLGLSASGELKEGVFQQAINVVEAVISPANWAKVRETMDAQAEEAGKLQKTIVTWVASIGGVLLVSWGAIANIPFMGGLINPPPATESNSLKSALKKGYYDMPNPQANIFSYFQYSPNCDRRVFVWAYSPFFPETDLSSLGDRFTVEKGWAKMLDSHQHGAPSVLYLKDLPSDAPLALLMKKFAAETIVTAPVIRQTALCPDGYVSSGYTMELSKDQVARIQNFMELFVAQNIDVFPVPQKRVNQMRPQQQEQFQCTVKDGVKLCHLRSLP